MVGRRSAVYMLGLTPTTSSLSDPFNLIAKPRGDANEALVVGMKWNESCLSRMAGFAQASGTVVFVREFLPVNNQCNDLPFPFYPRRVEPRMPEV